MSSAPNQVYSEDDSSSPPRTRNTTNTDDNTTSHNVEKANTVRSTTKRYSTRQFSGDIDDFLEPPPKRLKPTTIDAIGFIPFNANAEKARQADSPAKALNSPDAITYEEYLNAVYSPQPQVTATRTLSDPTLGLSASSRVSRTTSETVVASSFMVENMLPTPLGRLLRGEITMHPAEIVTHFARIRGDASID